MSRHLRVLPPVAVLVSTTIVPAYLLPHGWGFFAFALAFGIPGLLVADRVRPQPDFAILAAVIVVIASAAAFIMWVALDAAH